MTRYTAFVPESWKDKIRMKEKIKFADGHILSKIEMPKPVYYIMLDDTNIMFVISEPSKYPSAWKRFWMKALLGWIVRKP